MVQKQLRLPVGATIRDTFGGQFLVERLLGKGGDGAVYLVSDCRDSQRVFALKELINPSRQDRNRLFLERKVLKRLYHPALPRVYHVIEQEKLKRVYLLMEYIRGKNLDVLRKEQADGRFPVEQALSMVEPIVEALMYLHKQKPPILHRDIKPSNIIVPPDGGTATLVDFGSAKEYLPENTTTMFRYGTPGYAPIEQYSTRGITGTRTDIYGLGATLYALVTGVQPVDVIERVTKGHDVLKPAHVLVPEIPEAISSAISHAMAIYYEDRFATVKDFWQALHADEPEEEFTIANSSGMIAPLTSAAEKPEEQQRKRSRILVFTLAPVALLILGLLVFFMHSAFLVPSPQHAVSHRGTVIATTQIESPSVSTYPYPPISVAYAGTISDVAVAHKTTNLYLTQISQNRANLTGNFQGLGLIGSFTGTVSTAGKVHFILTYGGGTLILDGVIKVGGDMEGNFYALDSDQRKIGEYGIWYASSPS